MDQTVIFTWLMTIIATTSKRTSNNGCISTLHNPGTPPIMHDWMVHANDRLDEKCRRWQFSCFLGPTLFYEKVNISFLSIYSGRSFGGKQSLDRSQHLFLRIGIGLHANPTAKKFFKTLVRPFDRTKRPLPRARSHRPALHAKNHPAPSRTASGPTPPGAQPSSGLSRCEPCFVPRKKPARNFCKPASVAGSRSTLMRRISVA